MQESDLTQAPRLEAEYRRLPMKRLIMLILPILLVSGCVVVPPKSGSVAAPDTTSVCHKGKKTLQLPQSAVKAHLDHGDKLGPC